MGNITTTTTTSSVPKVTAPLIPSANADLDEKTISMQQKLINKQRELLELQQRKLELELLQTQVKLQEQLKNKLPLATTTANTITGTTSSLPLSTSAQVSFPFCSLKFYFNIFLFVLVTFETRSC